MGRSFPVDEEFQHASGRQTAGERMVMTGVSTVQRGQQLRRGRTCGASKNPGKHHIDNGRLLTY